MDVKLYRQRRNDSCAICCMMMVLDYFEISKCSKYNEKYYLNKLKSNYIKGTPLSAVAWFLSIKGLKVEIIHSEINLFKNNGYMKEEIFINAMKEYSEYLDYCKNKEVLIENNKDIDADFIKNKLNDNLIILSGFVNGVLHAVLVEAFIEGYFLVCDPMCNKKRYISNEDINKFCDTPIGKWCICVKM